MDENAQNYINMCSFHGLLHVHYHPIDQSGSCLDHFNIKTNKPTLTIVTNITLTDHQTVLNTAIILNH